MRRLILRMLALGALALPLALAVTPATSWAAKAPSTAKVTATFPAVRNATNLKKEPLPGKGRLPAPAKLAVRNLVVGHGATAGLTDTVEIQYNGTSYRTGKSFDSSWSRDMPSTFPMSGVIPGFAQGIAGMKVGGRREIVIPSALGYGPSGKPPTIAPNETQVFIVDLLKVTG
jgi:peptidylprolyl isomerase